MTAHERLVNYRVGADQWRGRILFTQETPVPGVPVEPDEDASALLLPEASADAQTPTE